MCLYFCKLKTEWKFPLNFKLCKRATTKWRIQVLNHKESTVSAHMKFKVHILGAMEEDRWWWKREGICGSFGASLLPMHSLWSEMHKNYNEWSSNDGVVLPNETTTTRTTVVERTYAINNFLWLFPFAHLGRASLVIRIILSWSNADLNWSHSMVDCVSHVHLILTACSKNIICLGDDKTKTKLCVLFQRIDQFILQVVLLLFMLYVDISRSFFCCAKQKIIFLQFTFAHRGSAAQKFSYSATLPCFLLCLMICCISLSSHWSCL